MLIQLGQLDIPILTLLSGAAVVDRLAKNIPTQINNNALREASWSFFIKLIKAADKLFTVGRFITFYESLDGFILLTSKWYVPI